MRWQELSFPYLSFGNMQHQLLKVASMTVRGAGPTCASSLCRQQETDKSQHTEESTNLKAHTTFIIQTNEVLLSLIVLSLKKITLKVAHSSQKYHMRSGSKNLFQLLYPKHLKTVNSFQTDIATLGGY